MNKQLPIYNIVIDEESGIDFVALVDRPAIQRDFMAFSQQKALSFEVLSEERKLLAGPLMLADFPIYRNFDGEECYVIFSKETIEKAAVKFFKNNYHTNVNLQHDEGLQMEGITLFQSWVYDEQVGTKPMRGYEDAKEGSWFGVFKVDNDVAWTLAKQGKLKGFSVEGVFNLQKQQLSAEEKLLEQIKALLCGLND